MDDPPPKQYRVMNIGTDDAPADAPQPQSPPQAANTTTTTTQNAAEATQSSGVSTSTHKDPMNPSVPFRAVGEAMIKVGGSGQENNDDAPPVAAVSAAAPATATEVTSCGGGYNVDDDDDEDPERRYRPLPRDKVRQVLERVHGILFEQPQEEEGKGKEESPATTTDQASTTDGGVNHNKENNKSSTPSHLQYQTAKRLRMDDLELFDDEAEQLFYWALAESNFPHKPSVLESEGVLQLVLAMVAHERSPVVIKGLRILDLMVGNEHTIDKKEEELYKQQHSATTSPEKGGATTEEEEEPTSSSWGTIILGLLTDACKRFPNKVEVQSFSCRVGAEVAQSDVESLLVSEFIVAVLTAMAKHRDELELQKAAVKMLSIATDQNREDPQYEAPVSVLFANVSNVLDLLLVALTRHSTVSSIASDVAQMLERMASHPANGDALIGSRAMTILGRVAEVHPQNCEIMSDVIAAWAHLVPHMVPSQKQSVVLLVRNVMTKVTDPDTLAACCALFHVVAKSFEPRPIVVSKSATSSPTKTTEAAASAETADDKPRRRKQLVMSEELTSAPAPAPSSSSTPSPSSSYEDDVSRFQRECDEDLKMKQFMSQHCVPFVVLALQHYGEDSEELRVAADVCLRSLSMNVFQSARGR